MNRSRKILVAALLISFAASVTGRANTVLEWNSMALEAIAQESVTPPVATRILAIVHAAVFDSLNTVEGQYYSYNFNGTAPAGTDGTAAAVSAAYTALSALIPNQAAAFQAKYNNDIASLGAGQTVSDGIALGQTVAGQLLNLRSNDGSANGFVYTGGTEPGQWRPTPPGYANALLPQWGDVTPFAIENPSAFAPSPPPALTSDEYTSAYNQVKDYGAMNSGFRDADQTEIAHFWSDGAGTSTPPGHWNRIAQTAAAELDWSEYASARAFALLNIALADVAISAWDAKYDYSFWRPVTAIVEGDNDTNPFTIGDVDWTPLLNTPPFPECASGHSTFSGAAAAILAAIVGYDEFAFIDTSESLPDVYRSFDSFSQAAIEAGISRIYGGIHFDFSDSAGRDSGAAIADYVSGNYLLPVPEPATLALLSIGGLLLRRRFA